MKYKLTIMLLFGFLFFPFNPCVSDDITVLGSPINCSWTHSLKVDGYQPKVQIIEQI